MKSQRIMLITAKVFSILLLLLIGAFFIEHLSWFLTADKTPPTRIYILSAFHLLLLIGYLIFLKWEMIGSFVILVSGTIFFSQIAREYILIYWIVSILPVLIFVFIFFSRKSRSIS